MGAGLAALGGAGAAVALQPAEGCRTLSPTELQVIEAVAVVLFPGGPFPLDGAQAGVAAEVDTILSDMFHPLHARGFRALVLALEEGTLASRGTRFSRLPVADRADVLRTWSNPSVFHRRLAGDAFRLVLGMAYFQHPAILAAIGWKPGCDDISRPLGLEGT